MGTSVRIGVLPDLESTKQKRHTMKSILLTIFTFLIGIGLFAQVERVTVSKGSDGMKLQVNGEDFMINGS